VRRLVLIASVFIATLFFAAAQLNTHSGSARQAAAMAASISSDLPMFAAEDAAQKHCPHDTVVWLNTSSGIYHLKGERWYGRTKHGAYVCKKEADAAGDRETEKGQ